MNPRGVRAPQFIVVGAPKCGTTALHAYLRQVPDLFVPEFKEPHFFARDLPLRRRLSEADYWNLFAEAPTTALRGEVSVWYLYSQEAARRIRETCGEVRIVAMLRHPVEAMHALHGQFVFNGDEDLTNLAAALAVEERRLQGSGRPPRSWVGPRCLCYREVYRYAEQLQRYIDHFGRDNVHVVLFDDFAANTAETFRKLLDFLHIEAPEQLDLRPLNAHRQLRWPWLKRLERSVEKPVRRLARRCVPQDLLRRRLGRRAVLGLRRFNSVEERRPPLGDELYARLQREMAPEIDRLEDLLEIDTGWQGAPAASP